MQQIHHKNVYVWTSAHSLVVGCSNRRVEGALTLQLGRSGARACRYDEMRVPNVII